MRTGSASRELARVRDLATADRTNLRGRHGHDRCSVAVKRGELDFEGLSVAIHVDYGADVTRFQ